MTRLVMSFALLFAGLLPALAQPSRASESLPKLIGTIDDLFGPDDYPDDARNAGESGLTVVNLRIASDGKVSDCTVARSSGSGSLDAATCRIAIEKARFIPLIDAAGRPVTGTLPLRIMWDIPAETPKNESLVAIATMDRGIVVACAAEVDSQPASAPIEECRSTFQPGDLALMFGESFVDAKEFRFVNARRLGTTAPAMPEGFRTAIVSEVVVQIGEDRKISNCTVRYPTDLPGAGPCSFSGYKKRFAGHAESFTDLTYIASDLPALPPATILE